MFMEGFSWRRLPWDVVVIVLALAAVSVVNLHSTEQGTESTAHLTQLGWFGAGTIMMFFVSTMDARFIRRLVPLFYVSVVIALALVRHWEGSQRLKTLAEFSFASFQPSELAKIAVILGLSTWFNRVTGLTATT